MDPSPYSTLVFLHVLAAILGLGPLTTLAVASSWPAPSMPAERFAQLLRVVGVSLGAMLATGVLLVQQTNGALGRTGWVRASLALFILLAVLHHIVRRRARRRQGGSPPAALPPGLRPLLWAMCALVAAITYLMTAKPF
ncbi:hypothetical protein KF840_03935 [bacterium]|nr:hypothetical protein [bacterium]